MSSPGSVASSSRAGRTVVIFVETRKGSLPKAVTGYDGDTAYAAVHRSIAGTDWAKKYLQFVPGGAEVGLDVLAQNWGVETPTPGQAGTAVFKLVARTKATKVPVFQSSALAGNFPQLSIDEEDMSDDPAAAAAASTSAASAAHRIHIHQQDANNVGAHAISNSAGAIGGQSNTISGVNTGHVSGGFNASTSSGSGNAAAGAASASSSAAAAIVPRLTAIANEDDNSQCIGFDTNMEIQKLVESQKVQYEEQISEYGPATPKGPSIHREGWSSVEFGLSCERPSWPTLFHWQ